MNTWRSEEQERGLEENNRLHLLFGENNSGLHDISYGHIQMSNRKLNLFLQSNYTFSVHRISKKN